MIKCLNEERGICNGTLYLFLSINIGAILFTQIIRQANIPTQIHSISIQLVFQENTTKPIQRPSLLYEDTGHNLPIRNLHI